MRDEHHKGSDPSSAESRLVLQPGLRSALLARPTDASRSGESGGTHTAAKGYG